MIKNIWKRKTDEHEANVYRA